MTVLFQPMPVHLRVEVIVDIDRVPERDERIDEMAADEPRAASDQ